MHCLVVHMTLCVQILWRTDDTLVYVFTYIHIIYVYTYIRIPKYHLEKSLYILYRLFSSDTLVVLDYIYI